MKDEGPLFTTSPKAAWSGFTCGKMLMGYASDPAIGRFQKLIELKQRTTLRGEVLFVSRAAGISDERMCHMAVT